MVIDRVYTQHVARYFWTLWTPEGKPDLSPLSVDSIVLPSIRLACERAAEDIVNKSKHIPEMYVNEACQLETLFNITFDELDDLAFKLLKKVYTEVQKTYYTVIIQDPTGTREDYTGYTPSYAFMDLEQLIKERGAVTGENATSTVRTQNLKSNACRKHGNVYICTQPVSCRTMCSFYDEPDDGQPSQCYFQMRNKNQKDMSDAFICSNAEAIKNCND